MNLDVSGLLQMYVELGVFVILATAFVVMFTVLMVAACCGIPTFALEHLIASVRG